MLGGGPSMAIASMWASMARWSTPTVLFCVLNLMIAAIFIASNFKSPNHHHNNMPSQLTRSSSLLERVKSMNLSSFYSTPESHDQDNVHSETTEYKSVTQLGPPRSLLQRVMSIDFSFSSSHDSFPHESEQIINSPRELTRAPSLLDRVKSFKPFNSDQQSRGQDEYSDINQHHDSVDDQNVTSASLSRNPGVTPVKRSVSSPTKSGREKRVEASDGGYQRQPAALKAAVEVHDESVDAKADDFIKRFKQQLKLQRLDSLQRLRRMLNRETSSA